MLYESYQDNRVYGAQTKITFPRKDPETGRVGEGTEILLMCPSREKAIECVSDPKFAFQPALIKRFVTDTTFKERVGTQRILRLERGKTDSYYLRLRDFPLKYIPTGARPAIVAKKKSIVNDISRWMELTFARMDNLSVRRKCSEFTRILKGRLDDPTYAGYNKILLFDLNSWNQSVKSCVVMNRKLLNNPLSILLYTACYFPEFLEGIPDIRIMVVNRAFGQIYFCHMSFLTRKNYPKIKAKLSKFKDLVFSVEDEHAPAENESDETIDTEVKSEVIASFKEDMKAKLRHNLLGPDPGDDPFSKIEDITPEVADPFDELDREMAEIEDKTTSKAPVISEPETEEESSDQNLPDDQIGDMNLTDEINEAIDNAFADIEDVEKIDTTQMVKNLAEQIKTTKYKATFMPERSDKEKARIERLTQGQQKALDLPTIEDSQRKALTTRTTGGYVRTSNPAITSSKFVDFDREYAKKCLDRNIDGSVMALSNASDKIFVTGKTVEDSSDSMNLKELYTYHLEDEKGNKMTVAFDVPKIIDGSYVYLNGTKKIVKHQLILKPIVKTGTDTVQIVTAYNKVFIYRQGLENQNINRLRAFIDKNAERCNTRPGNCSMLNDSYEIPLDMAMLSRYYLSFTAGDYTFYLSINSLLETYKKAKKKELVYDDTKMIPIAIHTRTREPLFLNLDQSYTDTVLAQFSEQDRKVIASIKRKPRTVVASAKIMKRFVPLVLFMMYCEGFASVMKKANIRYEFIDKKDRKRFDPMRWDFIELNDGLIAWEKVPFRNEIIMNGFRQCDMTDFTFEELESKDTFISLVASFYPGNSRIHFAFDNYRDFLIDEKTKEILTDFGYPTDLVSLLIVAAGMLTDTKYMIENNLNNMRVRSTEVISDLVYIALTNAYSKYRTTAYKKKPTKVSLKRSIIIDKLLDSDTNMVEEFSSLNPVLEIEKQRAVSFKGLRGIQMSRAMTLPRRCYDRSMLGTLAMSTPTDANVGVNRTLTLEPAITSTYGYIDASKSEDLEHLNSANLLSVTELLQPMGSLHDDPDRSSMSTKQTKYLIPINNADPVLFGSKVEATLPYLISDEFVVTAKQDGRVIERDENFCIIQYKDGTNYAIDVSDRVQRNAAAGFWIDNTLKCDLKVGQRFKEGDVLAYNDKHFSKNRDDRGASMNLGALCKIAISSQWDVFEDSAPISRKLSEKLTADMVDEKHITFSPYTHIDYIAKVGDKIKAGDPLVIFSDAVDPEMQVLLSRMREDMRENVIESAKTSISSKFTGEIVDIKIYTTSPPENLDPSLREVVETYWERIRKRNATLDQYKNQGDLGYYKAGQILREEAEVTKLGYNRKVAGYELEPGDVLILFYVRYQVAASKGDKIVCSVCKGIVSHVFEEGKEPYSEYRPDETIDTIVAPLAVSARKVPNIFLTIFTNKCLIELKRQLRDIYEG